MTTAIALTFIGFAILFVLIGISLLNQMNKIHSQELQIENLTHQTEHHNYMISEFIKLNKLLMDAMTKIQ